MSADKIILFTVVASVVVLVRVQISSADNFTIEQLLGTWYTDALINPNFNGDIVFSCSRTEITRKNHQTKYNVRAKVIINGKHHEFEGIGQVVDSQLHIVYPAIEKTGSIFDIISFNTDQELIFHDKDVVKYFLLLSHEKKSSAATRTVFEKYAAALGVQVIEVNQDDCD